jgi:hypothetical protein
LILLLLNDDDDDEENEDDDSFFFKDDLGHILLSPALNNRVSIFGVILPVIINN